MVYGALQVEFYFYFYFNTLMIFWALALEKYFTPKLSTRRAKVVLSVLCLHRPVVFCIGYYPGVARNLTVSLNSRTPASFNPYMPLQISV